MSVPVSDLAREVCRDDRLLHRVEEVRLEAQRLLGAPAPRQVSDEGDEAARTSPALGHGHAGDSNKPARAVRVLDLLLEGRLLAREHAADERAQLFVLLFAEDLAQAPAVQLAARESEPALVRAVVEAVALVGVEVGDGRGHGVEYEAQLLLAEPGGFGERRD